MLHLADRWIWDFWFADDGPDRHVFYLQAPRSLGDPNLRHENATVGHAVSQDLCSWEVLPDALGPAAPGAWDDLTIWTGSVLRRDGSWYFAYTGRNRAERGRVQRIGIAVSDDLTTWRRSGDGPTLRMEATWYGTPRGVDGDRAWRDPWLLPDPDGGGVLAFVTAYARTWRTDGHGAIALARSNDLTTWTVEAPVYAPGEFGEVEVPQVVDIGGAWRLVFSVPADAHGRAWSERTGLPGRSGSYYVTSSGGPTGPYDGAPVAIDQPAGDDLYSAKFVRLASGGWALLAARFAPGGGAFVGDLADPLPVDVTPDGCLIVG